MRLIHSSILCLNFSTHKPATSVINAIYLPSFIFSLTKKDSIQYKKKLKQREANMEYSPLKDSRQICLRKGTRSKYESNKTPEDRIEVLTSKSKRPYSWLTTIGNVLKLLSHTAIRKMNITQMYAYCRYVYQLKGRFCSKHWMTGIFLTVSEEAKKLITFPKIRGINNVRTRLLNSCLVGTDTPTPSATNFDIENGT